MRQLGKVFERFTLFTNIRVLRLRSADRKSSLRIRASKKKKKKIKKKKKKKKKKKNSRENFCCLLFLNSYTQYSVSEMKSFYGENQTSA